MKNTTLCYIEKDGSYLMLHRTKKRADANAGKWIGVGGKFEPDESPDDCLLREVREETGLALTRVFAPAGGGRPLLLAQARLQGRRIERSRPERSEAPAQRAMTTA